MGSVASSAQDSKDALSVALEDFKALRAELLQTMDNTRGVVQLNLAGAAVVVAAWAPIEQRNLQIGFLAFALLFVALQLVFLRYMQLHVEITRHLKDEVVPLLRSLAAPQNAELQSRLLTWYPGTGWTTPAARYPHVYKLIPATPAFLPSAAAAGCLAIFVISNGVDEWSPWTWVPLVLLDIVSILMGAWLAYGVGRRAINTNKVPEKL